ncbi:MAG: hypothetical protein IBX56_18180 [Methylomicrobium sp.]|nr:hypothetical protein [Methylomicrobium sp.]
MLVEGTSSASPLDEESGTASVIDAETIDRRMVPTQVRDAHTTPGVN